MKKLFIFVFILAIVISNVNALENSMQLLAVQETEDGFIGSLAELTLEIIPGKGRILLETQPLTKIDTQVSTRIAKEISCKYLDLDCSNLDFIYTIKSSSSIIGGPSAGSAMALITTATLKNLEIDEKVVITGTINSGNIIGPVGGIKEKIDVAETSGFEKVLVPKGEFIEYLNETISVEEYSKFKKIEVIEVSNLDEVLVEFTNINLSKNNNESVEIDQDYKKIMKNIAVKLCGRTYDMISNIDDSNYTKRYENLTQDIDELTEKEDYYSAASKCFTNNIRLRNKINENLEITSKILDKLDEEISDFEKKLDNRKLSNIPNLQTYIVVKERLNNAKEANDLAREELENNNSQASIEYYSFSIERLYSAESWSLFFEKEGKTLEINEENLKKSCIDKIEEANSRIQYLESIITIGLNDLDKDLINAKEEYKKGDYALCMNYASLAKAQADVIIGGTSIINETVIKELINQKLEIAKGIIIKQQESELFPILGYSYYEYSKNLINESIYSSLLFSQYSMELSDFSLYLENNKKQLDLSFNNESYLENKSNYELFLTYLVGIFSGIIIFGCVYYMNKN